MNRMDSKDLPKILASRTTGELLSFFRERVQSEPVTFADHLNLRLLEADFGQFETQGQNTDATHGYSRIAIVSLLFNWPSTGGGIVHTALRGHGTPETVQFNSACSSRCLSAMSMASHRERCDQSIASLTLFAMFDLT